jgi:hypothetical protein
MQDETEIAEESPEPEEAEEPPEAPKAAPKAKAAAKAPAPKAKAAPKAPAARSPCSARGEEGPREAPEDQGGAATRAAKEPKIDAEALLQLLLQPKPNPRQLQWQSFRMT